MGTATRGVAQSSDGDTGPAVVGAAIGAFSGGALSLLGSLEPCNRSLQGRRCVLLSMTTGGMVGLVSGGVMGSRNSADVEDRLRGLGIGGMVGSVAGLGLQRVVRPYDWADVGATTALGAAMGAAPIGSAIGFGAGAVTGLLLWQAWPAFQLSDAVAVALVGLASGALVDWVSGAAGAGDMPMTHLTFSIPTTIP
ncbi:MAG: hypothetical protein ACR2QM_13865 [Longimicrobiales bacterium]